MLNSVAETRRKCCKRKLPLFWKTKTRNRLHAGPTSAESAETTLTSKVRKPPSLPRVDSGIADLDEEESAWQINWVRILEPAPGQNIHTQDGTRIWFPTTFRDATMQHTLWITETAALQLANVSSPAEFQEAHKAGKLWFPLISSM